MESEKRQPEEQNEALSTVTTRLITVTDKETGQLHVVDSGIFSALMGKNGELDSPILIRDAQR